MPEFNGRYGEMHPAGRDATRASARLPGLDIEIVHRRAIEGDSEQISINLRAAPSFEAFGRALESANPFVFWMQTVQLAWLPWLEAARAAALPWMLVRSLPRPIGDGASGSVQGGSSSRVN